MSKAEKYSRVQCQWCSEWEYSGYPQSVLLIWRTVRLELMLHPSASQRTHHTLYHLTASKPHIIITPTLLLHLIYHHHISYIPHAKCIDFGCVERSMHTRENAIRDFKKSEHTLSIIKIAPSQMNSFGHFRGRI